MLDETLFAQFARVGEGRRIFRELLTPDAAAQQAQFLAGEIQNPDLYYILPDAADLQAEVTALGDLRHAVQTTKADWPQAIADPLASLYNQALDEAIAERQLLMQGYSPDRSFDATAFMAAQKAVYGDMQPELFWFSLRSFAQKADLKLLQHDTAPAVRELTALFDRAQTEPGSKAPTEIPANIQAAFEPLLHTDAVQSAIHPGADGLVDILELFAAALQVYGAQDWRVVHRPAAPNLAVDKMTQEVIVNDAHRFLPVHQALEKTLHEIGVHVQRSKARSNVALYNAGLPGYHKFEEGLACVMANIRQPEVRVNGQRLYAGIGLALGLDGGPPRDFRAVFELLWRIDVVRGDNPMTARKTAYKRCVRLFRGADPAVQGNCHLRDKSYVEGIFAVLGFFARTPVTPELAGDLLTYRFTPTDAVQQKLVRFIQSN